MLAWLSIPAAKAIRKLVWHPYSLGSPDSSLPTGVMPPRLARNRRGLSLPQIPACSIYLYV